PAAIALCSSTGLTSLYTLSLHDALPISSISLTPMSTRVWKSSSFSCTFMGSIRAWLPSRRSTEHQMGGAVSCLSGQVRSGRERRSEEHTSELQSRFDLVCRRLLEQKRKQ